MKTYKLLILIMGLVAATLITLSFLPNGLYVVKSLGTAIIDCIAFVLKFIITVFVFIGAIIVAWAGRVAIERLDDNVEPHQDIGWGGHIGIAITGSLFLGILWMAGYYHIATSPGFFMDLVSHGPFGGPFETMPVGMGILFIVESFLSYAICSGVVYGGMLDP